MKCAHCKIEIGNQLVSMEDNSVCCYTCGRLKAEQDMSCREIRRKWIALKVLEDRRDLYAVGQ